MVANLDPPSYFREITLNLVEDLIDDLAAGKHISLIAPRQSGKAVLLFELMRRAQQIKGADAPKVVLLRSLPFHALENGRFLEKLATTLDVPLAGWDDADNTPLSAKVADLVRRAAKRSLKPLWLFVQNITEYPWPSGRAILEAMQEISLDPRCRKISVLVSGNQEFVSLTYQANSPYRHAHKFFLTGLDRELTHRFYRARVAGLSLAEGFDKLALASINELPDDVLDCLHEQTGGYAKFIEEILLTIKRPSPENHYENVGELKSPSVVEQLIDRFLREHMPFDTYCYMSLRDVQRNKTAWDRLQRIVDGATERVLLGSTQPDLLETSGIVRRDSNGLARIASPMWERYLKARLTPRYRGDINALLGDWEEAWKCYENALPSVCDRALDGEERYLLNDVIKAWEANLVERVADGSSKVVSSLLAGARHLLGCESCGLFEVGSNRLISGFPNNLSVRSRTWDDGAIFSDPECEISLQPGRLTLRSASKQTETSKNQGLSAYLLMNRSENREFDSSTLETVRRTLRRFWLAYETAQRAEYDATLGSLRERYLSVMSKVNESLTVNHGDLKSVVDCAVNELVETAGYYRVIVCFVSPRGARIQAVAHKCQNQEKDIDFPTDYPLDSRSNEDEWDIQQWVVIKGQATSVADASCESQIRPRTQHENVKRLGMKGICVVPMTVRRKGVPNEEVIGTIHLEKTDKLPLSADEIGLSEQFASQLAVVLDQARRMSMLERSLGELDDRISIVSPQGRVIFRNRAGMDSNLEPTGWQFPITVPSGEGHGQEMPEAVSKAEQLKRGVHLYVKKQRAKRRGLELTRHVDDEFAAPITEFGRSLKDSCAPDSTVGYVHQKHLITDLVQMHEALYHWLEASSPRETARRILRFFRMKGSKWCRIYRLKQFDGKKNRQIESFSERGIRDATVKRKFRNGGFCIDGSEHEQQANFLVNKTRCPTIFRYDATVTGEPVLEANPGIGFPVYRTRDNWRDEFRKTDDLWIEAPMFVGETPVGIIALSLPPGLDRSCEFPTPEACEKLRWSIVSASVALHYAFQNERRVAVQEQETARAASELAIHQLSNKLAPSQSNAYLARMWLMKQPEVSDRVKEHVGNLLQAAINGIRSSCDILKDFRRYASDRPFDDIRDILVSDLLLNAANVLRGINPDVKVTVEPVPPSLRIRGSESALREVFEILFHNSVRHSRRSPGVLEVALSAEMVVVNNQQGKEEPRSCRLNFEDNGNGILPSDLETVFKPFYTTHDQGNGLGLPIARRLITRHGGSISAAGSLGGGARFEIIVPLVEPSAMEGAQ